MFGGIVVILMWLTSVAAWVTHVIYCLSTAKYMLLLAGALFFPIGIVHGVCIWLGLPWV